VVQDFDLKDSVWQQAIIDLVNTDCFVRNRAEDGTWYADDYYDGKEDIELWTEVSFFKSLNQSSSGTSFKRTLRNGTTAQGLAVAMDKRMAHVHTQIRDALNMLVWTVEWPTWGGSRERNSGPCSDTTKAALEAGAELAYEGGAIIDPSAYEGAYAAAGEQYGGGAWSGSTTRLESLASFTAAITPPCKRIVQWLMKTIIYDNASGYSEYFNQADPVADGLYKIWTESLATDSASPSATLGDVASAMNHPTWTTDTNPAHYSTEVWRGWRSTDIAALCRWDLTADGLSESRNVT
jgi:hypothetical protein